MPALVGLLLVVFVIAGLLVYEAWNTGRSRREIAERFGVSTQTIHKISSRRSFRDIGGPDPAPPRTRARSG